VKKGGMGLHPYAGTGALQFFRGAGLQAAIPLLGPGAQLVMFCSRRNLPARKNDDGVVTGFLESGAGGQTVREDLLGGRFEFSPVPFLALGYSAFRSLYDSPCAPGLLGMSGTSSLAVLGTDIALRSGRGIVFCEVAHVVRNATAFICGSVVGLGNGSSVTIAYREYPMNFANPHANGFGRGSDTRNERGVAMDVTWILTDRVTFRCSCDQFASVGRSWYAPLPSSGQRVAAYCDIRCSSAAVIGVRLLRSVAEEPRPGVHREAHSLRVTSRLAFGPAIRAEGRVEVSMAADSPSGSRGSGFLASQQLEWRPVQSLVLVCRYMAYDVSSYDARLATLERDLPGVVTQPVLLGVGERWWILFQWSPFTGIRLSMKYSTSISTDAGPPVRRWIGAALEGAL
jgi:hypothetical protein